MEDGKILLDKAMRLVDVMVGKIIVGAMASIPVSTGFKEMEKTLILDTPSKAMSVGVMDMIPYADFNLKMDIRDCWDDVEWHKYVDKHKWLAKLEINFPVGDRIATSELDKMKLDLFMKVVDYDNEICEMIWDGKERARFQREILDTNIVTLVVNSK